MTALAPAATAISAQTAEAVLGHGNLANLSPAQRVEYMMETCRSLGLNPLTRPFRFMSFQGQTVLYATRDCTDQLRKLHHIDLSIVEKHMDGELFIVTARARTPDGRSDEDIGAVSLGKLMGDARANATMKALTKAKRRVTLSICGLGFLDETEVETLRGARLYDAADPPLIPEPKPEPPHAPPAPPKPEPTHDGDVVEYRVANSNGGKVFSTGSEWIAYWRTAISACKQNNKLDRLRAGVDLNREAFAAVEEFDPAAAKEVADMLAAALPAQPELPEWPSQEGDAA